MVHRGLFLGAAFGLWMELAAWFSMFGQGHLDPRPWRVTGYLYSSLAQHSIIAIYFWSFCATISFIFLLLTESKRGSKVSKLGRLISVVIGVLVLITAFIVSFAFFRGNLLRLSTPIGIGITGFILGCLIFLIGDLNEGARFTTFLFSGIVFGPTVELLLGAGFFLLSWQEIHILFAGLFGIGVIGLLAIFLYLSKLDSEEKNGAQHSLNYAGSNIASDHSHGPVQPVWSGVTTCYATQLQPSSTNTTKAGSASDPVTHVSIPANKCDICQTKDASLSRVFVRHHDAHQDVWNERLVCPHCIYNLEKRGLVRQP